MNKLNGWLFDVKSPLLLLLILEATDAWRKQYGFDVIHGAESVKIKSLLTLHGFKVLTALISWIFMDEGGIGTEIY